MGGSICERRMNCLASYGLELQAPKPASTSYADEGTMLHSVMAKILDGEKVEDLIGYEELGHTLTVDLVDEMITPALRAFDNLLIGYGIENIEYITEVNVEYPGIKAWGQTDVLGHDENYTLLVDWKFGRGVMVAGGPENYQLKFYGGAGRETPETKDMFDPGRPIILAVIQPAAPEPLTHGLIGDNRLTNFVGRMKETVELILDEENEFDASPGKWCRFCPAAAICPAKQGLVQSLTSLGPVDPEIEPHELGLLVRQAYEVEAWASEVKALAHSELDKGRSVAGYKLVNKRATRQWVDEGDAETAFRKMKVKVGDFTVSKLVSPAQAEKMLKAVGKDPSVVGDLAVSRSSGTTMAEADDKRPAVTNQRGGGDLNLPASALK
jgi:hypothetical protein